MNEPTNRAPELFRCPRCCGAAEIRTGYACSKCGKGSPRWMWKSATKRFPMQVEEADGGACERCGERVVVHLSDEATAGTRRRPRGVGFILVFLALGLANRWRAGLWTYPIAIAIVVALAWILHRLYKRHGGDRVERSVAVICEGCGFVRLDGCADETVAARFWRGRSYFIHLSRWALAVLGFFAVVLAGSYAVGERPDPTVALSLGIAAAFWIETRACLRPWCPESRRVVRG